MYKRALHEEVYRVVAIPYNGGGDPPSSPPGCYGLCSVQARGDGRDRHTRMAMPARVWKTHACRAQRAPASACRPRAGLKPGVSFGMLSATLLSFLLVYAHGASPWRQGDAPSLRGRWLCLLSIKVNS